MAKKQSLTAIQREAYAKLTTQGPDSSYGLGYRLNTMYALVRKGFATRSNKPGSAFFPRSLIIFKAIK